MTAVIKRARSSRGKHREFSNIHSQAYQYSRYEVVVCCSKTRRNDKERIEKWVMTWCPQFQPQLECKDSHFEETWTYFKLNGYIQ